MDQVTLAEEMAVAARLRAYRHEKGFSLETLADACGVSRSMLSKIERGESVPTVGAAVRIARALDLPLARLLGVEERGAVSHRPAAYQEALADPQSGTTRYQLVSSGAAGFPRVERLVAPPGSSALALPAVAEGECLSIAVGEGRFEAACAEDVWPLGPGDALTLPGPARVTLLPEKGELAVAYLVTARITSHPA